MDVAVVPGDHWYLGSLLRTTLAGFGSYIVVLSARKRLYPLGRECLSARVSEVSAGGRNSSELF